MKDVMYKLFTDIWRLAYKYHFRPMDDTDWESFIADGYRLFERYRRQGKLAEKMCRELFGAVQEYYQAIGKELVNEQEKYKNILHR